MSLTQQDLQQIQDLLSPLATKQDLHKQSEELKAYTTNSITKAIDDLARNVLQPSFQHLEQRLNIIEDILVEDRLPAAEKEFHKLQNYKEAIKQARQS